VDDLAVGVVDESVEEHSDTFVTPDTQELMDSVEAIWCCHCEAVVDA